MSSKLTIAFFCGLITVCLGAILYQQNTKVQDAVGGFSDTFLSIQVGTNPSNGECLTTDGTNSTWGACSGEAGANYWNDAGAYLYPKDGDYVQSPYFTATSTSATSTFPRLTSTNLAVTGKLYAAGSPGVNGRVLQTTGTGIQWVATSSLGISGGGGSGTVTSVAQTVPTGFSVSGSPVTTSGTLAISYAAGYSLPLTASSTAWQSFYTTPSTRITAGDALTWSSNTINFDGGNTPAGDLGGTWASPSVTDDSHAHTGTTLSGIDISDDTNLTAGDGLTITLDDIDCDTASGTVFGCLSATDHLLFGNKLGTTSINSLAKLETITGVSNILIENDIDASSELQAIMDDENGTGGGLVFASSTHLTSPTLFSFFGTPCTGNTFLQDISDTGAFTCTEATGGGGGGGALSTTTDIIGAGGLQLVSYVTGDVMFGGSASTTAEFQFDDDGGQFIISSTTANATATIASQGTSDAVRITGSSTRGLELNMRSATNFVFNLIGSFTTFVFNEAVSLLSTLTFDGETFDSLTDDPTLANNAGDLQVVDVTCTDCLNATEIEDIYALTAGDAFTGHVTLTSASSTSQTLTGVLHGVAAIFTGLVDIGGGILEIPNGANPTADDPGEIASDTTDNQVIVDDRVIRTKEEIFKFSVGSTSPWFASAKTKRLPRLEDGYTITDIQCDVEGGTSKSITVFGETIVCDTNGEVDDGAISSSTVAALGTAILTQGATTGSVNYLNVTISGTYTRE